MPGASQSALEQFTCGHIGFLQLAGSIMRDDTPQPPFIYEGLDPALQPKTPIADVADTVPVVRGFDALV
jgi:hypothetical protein